MFRDGLEYFDVAADHLAQRDPTRLANRLIRRIGALGLEVQVQAAA